MSTYRKAIHILSGTDDDIIESMPISVKRKRASWAYMLVFTAMLSFAGAYHFMLTMFIDNSSTEITIPISGYVIAFLIAIIYTGGMALFSIDSMSSSNKLYALLRMPISFVSSVLIALPLTLHMFSDSIYQKINENLNHKTEQYITANVKVDTSLNDSISILQKEINDLRNYKNNAMKEADEFSLLEHNEVIGKGIGNTIAKCGPKCEKFKSQKEDALFKVAQIESKIKLKYAKIDKLRNQYNADNMKKEKSTKAYFNELNSIQSYDILSQIKVLEELMFENTIISVIVALLVLTLIILDLLPTIGKLFTDTNEYDVLLSNRIKINRAKLMSVFYSNMNKISKGDTSMNVIPLMITTVEK